MFHINQLLQGFFSFLKSCYDVFSNLITSQTSAQVPKPAQVKLDGKVVSIYQQQPSPLVFLLDNGVLKVDGDVRSNIENENGNIISI